MGQTVMRPDRKHGRRIFDRSIVMTIVVISVVSLLVMGYKFITYRDCSDTDFVIKEGQLIAGHIVSFEDLTAEADEREWDFGDGTSPSTGKEVMHIFKHPGDYWITLEAGGGCAVRKKVTILNNKSVVDSSQYPVFSMPPHARVGDPVRFTDHTAGAQKWQWSFGETMQIDAVTREPTYIFQSSGVKTVALIVNGNEGYTAKKHLTVFARPVEKPEFDFDLPEKAAVRQEVSDDTISIAEVPMVPPLRPVQLTRAPEINRIQLEDYLLQIAEGNRRPETLPPYGCAGFDSRVRANGEGKTLRRLLQDIKGEKISIEHLEVVKQKETRCIDFIKITYKRKKVLGIF